MRLPVVPILDAPRSAVLSIAAVGVAHGATITGVACVPVRKLPSIAQSSWSRARRTRRAAGTMPESSLLPRVNVVFPPGN
jgi:hypothetical protein